MLVPRSALRRAGWRLEPGTARRSAWRWVAPSLSSQARALWAAAQCRKRQSPAQAGSPPHAARLHTVCRARERGFTGWPEPWMTHITAACCSCALQCSLRAVLSHWHASQASLHSAHAQHPPPRPAPRRTCPHGGQRPLHPLAHSPRERPLAVHEDDGLAPRRGVLKQLACGRAVRTLDTRPRLCAPLQPCFHPDCNAARVALLHAAPLPQPMRPAAMCSAPAAACAPSRSVPAPASPSANAL